MRENHRARCVLLAVNQEVYGHGLRYVEGATAERVAVNGIEPSDIADVKSIKLFNISYIGDL